MEDGDSTVTGLTTATLAPNEGQPGFYRGIFDAGRFKGGGLMSMGGFEEIPDADWLADAAKDAPATERALGALAAPRKP
jgi:hypothetical protein